MFRIIIVIATLGGTPVFSGSPTDANGNPIVYPTKAACDAVLAAKMYEVAKAVSGMARVPEGSGQCVKEKL